MKKFSKHFITTLVLGGLFTCILMAPISAYAATSPILVGSSNYSVLGGSSVTCTGSSTTSGAVGVSPGTAINGFPTPCTAGGGTDSNDASAIAAQADSLTAFGALDQPCTQTYGAQDLTLLSPLPPGVYCSTSSFTLSGNLTLTGSGVWIFKTVSTLITSSGSSITGGDPCNVWWRVGSSATLGTTSAFIGTIIAQNGLTALDTGATLDGRVLALSAASVTLDANTITGPTCATTSSSGGGGSSGGGSPSSTGSTTTPTSSVTTGSATTTASSTPAPGAPDTGFGVSNTSLWRNVSVYGIGATGLFTLAFLSRLTSKKQP
jgi:hypothetical protein